MGTIKTVFCWTGGVILPAIPDITIQLLQSKHNHNVDFWLRKSIRELAEELFIGKLDGRSYCRAVIEKAGGSSSAEDLEAAHLREATLKESILAVLAELPSIYQIWLISDYPPDWFRPISAQLTPFPFVHAERVIFTKELGLTNLVPDIIPQLTRSARQPMEACMVVDGDPRRAVEAVKHGLSSAILIDSFRLRREFGLRKMLSASN